MVTLKLRGVVAAFGLFSGWYTYASEVPVQDEVVLARRTVQAGGQKITIKQIAPPTRKKIDRRTPAPTAEELAIDARRATKQQVVLNLSATVFEDDVTELKWTHNGRKYHAYSNVNFLYFSGIGELETDKSVFLISISLGRGSPSTDDAFVALFRKTASSLKSPEYVVYEIDGGVQEESAYLCLDALHAHYELNKDGLIKSYQDREKQNEKRAEELRKNPPTLPDVEIRYWPVSGTKERR